MMPLLYLNIERGYGCDLDHGDWTGAAIIISLGIWRLRLEFWVGWR
jgi:hypothetical protein